MKQYSQTYEIRQIPKIILEYSNKGESERRVFPRLPLGSPLINQSKQKKIKYFTEERYEDSFSSVCIQKT